MKNKLRGQRFSTSEEAVDAFKTLVLEIPQSDWKTASKIGSNACKSVLIFMENISKNNKTNFDDKYLFFHY